MINKEQVGEIIKILKNAEAEEIISYFVKNFGTKLVFASSLGAEDQVLTHMLVNIDRNIKIVTLDTGRLFPETYDLIDRTNKRFNIKLDVYFPDYKEVEKMVKEHGVNLFYNSIEHRKLCCKVRKIKPLQRALQGKEVWITGLRRGQSITRTNIDIVEWDEVHNMLKVNPLVNWSERQVWEYIRTHDIPYNVLHDKSYPSIGCRPCTRAIKPGEDIRAGRWWWEQPEKKECGLHVQN